MSAFGLQARCKRTRHCQERGWCRSLGSTDKQYLANADIEKTGGSELANREEQAQRGAEDDLVRRELFTQYEIGDRGRAASYLWVAEVSTSEIPSATGASRVDALISIPVLQWSPPNESDASREAMKMQNAAVGAVELKGEGYPTVAQPPKGLKFSVQNTLLRVWRQGGTAGMFEGFEWPIDNRLAWYLEQSGTLSLLVVGADSVWVSVALNDRQGPLVGCHRGTVLQKNYTSIIEHSKSWQFGRLGNVSLAADKRDADDDHFDIYASDEKGAQLPSRLTHSGRCISCDSPASSREHCTPDWIARDQCVQPVTSKLFCRSCNSYFGEDLEAPISQRYRDGSLSSVVDSELFARWAIKTALTLSVASGVRIQNQWMRELRQGGIPEGFEVYAETELKSAFKGYIFGATMFSAIRHQKGYVLVTFAIPGLLFSVVRSTAGLGKFGPIARVYPARLEAEGRPQEVDISDLHAAYLEKLTGTRVKFAQKEGRRAQNRT